MYRAYFGFKEKPFALTPDPRFLFMSQRHREALAHLLYGVGESGGFVQLTGEVGTGKTTLCRSLLEQAPEEVDVALILNPKQTALELLQSICDEFDILYAPRTVTIKVLVDRLNHYLLGTHVKGKRAVLVIDEAQSLSLEALEQVRLLTNLETTTHKLLQVVLIGQPELRAMLARPDLRQLAQRVTARFHLTPLARRETVAYVQHRIDVAGCHRPLFTPGALNLVHKLSGGVPRLINVICDRALLGAYAHRRDRVGMRLVRKAAAEVMGQSPWSVRRSTLAWALAVLLVTLLGVGVWFVQGSFLGQLGLVGNEARISRLPARGIQPGSPGQSSAAGPTTVEGPGERLESLAEQTVLTPEESGSASGVLSDPQERPGSQLGGRLRLLQDIGADAGPDSAFTALFDAWALPYAKLEGATACERAANAGLRCLKSSEGWAGLRRYDRPAVLELVANGRAHHVTAVGLTQTEVALVLAGRRVTLPRAELEPYWSGDFTLLWRPPKIETALLRRGSAGPDVVWLRAQLDRAEGVSPAPGGGRPEPLFNDSLEKRVMGFQRTHGLHPDGLVRDQTLMRLNAAVGDLATPVLWRPDR